MQKISLLCATFFKHNHLICAFAFNLNLMKKNSLPVSIIVSIVGCMYFLSSCSPTKNVLYFQTLQQDTNIPVLVDSNFELKIRKNDLLGITIISPDPISTPLFNGLQSTSPSPLDKPEGSSGGASGGYLVDGNGNIQLYKLGILHVEGLTRNQLKLLLEKSLIPYLKDAVITVRFLNKHVTILGEVLHPSVVIMPTEKLTLLDALAMTGDITNTGRKDNILVIRETPGGNQVKRLDLTNHSVFTSPFYYMKPNDVVYVEPTTSKIKSNNSNPQTFTLILTLISIAATLILSLRK